MERLSEKVVRQRRNGDSGPGVIGDKGPRAYRKFRVDHGPDRELALRREKKQVPARTACGRIPDNCIDSRRRRWHISCQIKGRVHVGTAAEPGPRPDRVRLGARLMQPGQEGERNRRIRIRPQPGKVLKQCSSSQEKIYYRHRACSSGDRATDF